MNKSSVRSDRKNFRITIGWLLVVLIPNGILCYLTAFSFVPPSWGWFTLWSKLAGHQRIYKDFYVPVPPLGVWIHGIVPNLFDGNVIFVESLIEVGIWIGICALLFFLAKQIWSARDSAIGALVATLFYFAYPVNKVAGYYETHLLVVLAALLATIRACRSKKVGSIFLAGLLSGAIPFTKQTSSLIPVFLTAALVWRISDQREMRRVRLAYLISGCAIVPTSILIWSIRTDNTFAMIRALSGGGGKSPSLVRVLTWGTSDLARSAAWWPWIACFGGIVLLANQKSPSDTRHSFTRSSAVALVGLLVTVGIVSPQVVTAAFSLSETIATTYGLLIIAAVVVICLSASSKLSKFLDSRQRTISITIGLSAFAILLILTSTSGFVAKRSAIVDYSAQGSIISNSLGLGGAVFICVLLVVSLKSSAVSKMVLSHEESDPPLDLPIKSHSATLIAVSMMLLALGNSMSAGSTAEAWSPAVAVLVAALSGILFAELGRWRSTILGVAILAPLFTTFVARPMTEPYSWWSIRLPRLEIDRKELHIGQLNRMTVNSSEFQFWTQLKNLIGDTKEPIFSGPNISGIPDLLGYQTAFGHCVVLWWDVCPEELAKDDFKWLQESHPKVIVWMSPPEFVMEAHESAFRGGQVSAVREIDSWIKSSVAGGRYVKVGSAEIPESGVQVDVMKLSDVLKNEPK